jgi:hypothetical protein
LWAWLFLLFVVLVEKGLGGKIAEAGTPGSLAWVNRFFYFRAIGILLPESHGELLQNAALDLVDRQRWGGGMHADPIVMSPVLAPASENFIEFECHDTLFVLTLNSQRPGSQKAKFILNHLGNSMFGQIDRGRINLEGCYDP